MCEQGKKGLFLFNARPRVEFKQKLQLASRTSRYKNQLVPPDILLARPSWGQLLKII